MFLFSPHEDISLAVPPSFSLTPSRFCMQTTFTRCNAFAFGSAQAGSARRTCTVRAACRIFTSPPLQTYACGVFEKISTRVLPPSLSFSHSARNARLYDECPLFDHQLATFGKSASTSDVASPVDRDARRIDRKKKKVYVAKRKARKRLYRIVAKARRIYIRATEAKREAEMCSTRNKKIAACI